MPTAKHLALVELAMLAFAGNSLLCRMALKGGAIAAARFTSVRLVSGALMLGVLVWLQQRQGPASQRLTRLPGDGWSALALFVYAAGFSFAYPSMSAATGALLLFGAVQATMIAHGLWSGERLQRVQLVGFGFLGGSTPPLPGDTWPHVVGKPIRLSVQFEPLIATSTSKEKMS